MALVKNIEIRSPGMPIPVPLYYHRILGMTQSINTQTTIEVVSYPSENDRKKEQEWYAAHELYTILSDKDYSTLTEEEKIFVNNFDPMAQLDVFIQGKSFSIPYSENITIEDAYAYLKTTDYLYGALDV